MPGRRRSSSINPGADKAWLPPAEPSANHVRMAYTEELEAAVAAVQRASALCVRVQKSLVSEESLAKKDRSPVTVADFGAQAVVAHALLDAFPNDPMVGEEDASALRDPANEQLAARVIEGVSTVTPGLDHQEVLDLIDHGTYEGGGEGRHWTLDPIDGTKGFLRGDQYAVALALIDRGEVVLGVLGCPNLLVDSSDPEGPRGCFFFSEKGKGTTMRRLDNGNESHVSVSGITDASQARFCESVEAAHSSQDDTARVAALLGIEQPPFRIDSQCKYAAVARGDASIYMRLPTRKDYEEKIWDHAAGMAVVSEAGGRVTDVAGRDLDFSLGRTLRENRGVVVSNGDIHDEVIAAVREVLQITD